MDDWKNGRVVNRERFGERVVWKKEKVKKWEMPSCTHTGKSTDPPSHCLDAFQTQSPGRQLPAFGWFSGGARQSSFQNGTPNAS